MAIRVAHSLEISCDSAKNVGCRAYSVGDGGEGAHVVLGQLEVQGLQVGLDVLRVDSLEGGAHAPLYLPAQQHLHKLSCKCTMCHASHELSML